MSSSNQAANSELEVQLEVERQRAQKAPLRASFFPRWMGGLGNGWGWGLWVGSRKRVPFSQWGTPKFLKVEAESAEEAMKRKLLQAG